MQHQFDKKDFEKSEDPTSTQTQPESAEHSHASASEPGPAGTEQKAAPSGKLTENVHEAVANVKREVNQGQVPWYRSKKRATILLIAYAIQLSLFAILAWWVHINPVLPIDVRITKEFQENQNPLLHGLMVFVSSFGNFAWLFTGLVVLAVVLLWVINLRLEAVVMAIEVTFSGVLNVALKLLIGRPRPTTKLVEVFQVATGQSFPSGHVMSYVAFWGLLFSFGVILLSGKRWWHKLVLIIPAFFVALVGPSRIYLGDHWASDVLGAYLIGGVLLGITIWIYLNLKARGVLVSPKMPRYLMPPVAREKAEQKSDVA